MHANAPAVAATAREAHPQALSLATIARLSSDAAAAHRDLTANVDWATDPATGVCLKVEQLLSLYDTPFWTPLDADQRRRLAWLEGGHLWRWQIQLHTFTVNLLSQILLRELTPKRQAIPGEVRDFLTHVAKEECAHVLLLSRACDAFQVPAASFPIEKPRLFFAGLGWAPAMLVHTMFAWLLSEAWWRGTDSSTVHPTARQLAVAITGDLRRHVAFGLEVWRSFWPLLPETERDTALAQIAGAVRVSIDELLVEPSSIRALARSRGDDDPLASDADAIADAIRRSPAKIALCRDLYGAPLAFLRELAEPGARAPEVLAKAGLLEVVHGVES